MTQTDDPVGQDPLRQKFDAEILRRHHRKKTLEEIDEQHRHGQDDRQAKFKKLLDSDPEFYVIYQSANIAATWLSFVSVGLIHDLSEQDDAPEPLNEQAAALAFFSRLASDLWAIIELVELGFDLQARTLTRGFLEHVDVLICCIQDKEMTREFVQAKERDEENAFWHKHVSKNRAKAKVTKFIAGVLGKETVTLVDRLREDADYAGSALIHPTMVAGLATAFGDPDDHEDYGIFPTPRAGGAGPLRAILIHLFWLSFATGALPQGWGGEWRPIFRTERLKDEPELKRRQLLNSRMFGFLLDHHILMKPVKDPTGAEDDEES